MFKVPHHFLDFFVYSKHNFWLILRAAEDVQLKREYFQLTSKKKIKDLKENFKL